ncbi:hypothetical protein ASF57_12255 [Methylobacterium sp. Leaf117]|nr:hypothetical protein ASF57_12255 [Methylobacterium sp. Leaf117]
MMSLPAPPLMVSLPDAPMMMSSPSWPAMSCARVPREERSIRSAPAVPAVYWAARGAIGPLLELTGAVAETTGASVLDAAGVISASGEGLTTDERRGPGRAGGNRSLRRPMMMSSPSWPAMSCARVPREERSIRSAPAVPAVYWAARGAIGPLLELTGAVAETTGASVLDAAGVISASGEGLTTDASDASNTKSPDVSASPAWTAVKRPTATPCSRIS